MKLSLGILLFFIPLAARATCSPEDVPYELKQTDRAYEQAMKLKAAMEHQGIEIACVLPSKSVHMFRNQLGAAFYRTSIGVLDAMIIPDSIDFHIHVVETRRDNRYFYTFEGKPDVDTDGWDASYKTYFVQHRNFMLSTTDEKTAEKLKSVLQAP